MPTLQRAILTAALATCAATLIAAPTAQAPCSGPTHRELDFWIGEWNVFDTAKGRQVGTSSIEAIMAGCAIRERFHAPTAAGSSYSGTSYSAFDRKDGKWHQFYVDVNGNATWFTGAREANDMVLYATVKGGATQRMTYHSLSNGAVEQIGVISTDGGKSWQPGYDLTYRRK